MLQAPESWLKYTLFVLYEIYFLNTLLHFGTTMVHQLYYSVQTCYNYTQHPFSPLYPLELTLIIPIHAFSYCACFFCLCCLAWPISAKKTSFWYPIYVENLKNNQWGRDSSCGLPGHKANVQTTWPWRPSYLLMMKNIKISHFIAQFLWQIKKFWKYNFNLFTLQ